MVLPERLRQLIGEYSINQFVPYNEVYHSASPYICAGKVGRTFRFAPLEHHMYPFVSVTEHFCMAVKWSLHCLPKSEIKKNDGDIGGVAP